MMVLNAFQIVLHLPVLFQKMITISISSVLCTWEHGAYLSNQVRKKKVITFHFHFSCFMIVENIIKLSCHMMGSTI